MPDVEQLSQALHLDGCMQVSQSEWDSLVEAQEEVNPFLKWAFLNALEASKSAVSALQSKAVPIKVMPCAKRANQSEHCLV